MVLMMMITGAAVYEEWPFWVELSFIWTINSYYYVSKFKSKLDNALTVTTCTNDLIPIECSNFKTTGYNKHVSNCYAFKDFYIVNKTWAGKYETLAKCF